MGRLGVATNANDILARFWRSGAYEKIDSTPSPPPPGQSEPAAGASDGKQAADASGVKETLSPAMDILVSSNFERLLWYLAFETAEGTDVAERQRKASATIADWMGKVKSDGRVQVPVAVLELARRDFFAERVSDAQASALHSFPHTEQSLKCECVHRLWRPSSTTLRPSHTTSQTHTLRLGYVPPAPSLHKSELYLVTSFNSIAMI